MYTQSLPALVCKKVMAVFRRRGAKVVRSAGCWIISCLCRLHSNTGHGTNSGNKNISRLIHNKGATE